MRERRVAQSTATAPHSRYTSHTRDTNAIDGVKEEMHGLYQPPLLLYTRPSSHNTSKQNNVTMLLADKAHILSILRQRIQISDETRTGPKPHGNQVRRPFVRREKHKSQTNVVPDAKLVSKTDNIEKLLERLVIQIDGLQNILDRSFAQEVEELASNVLHESEASGMKSSGKEPTATPDQEIFTDVPGLKVLPKQFTGVLEEDLDHEKDVNQVKEEPTVEPISQEGKNDCPAVNNITEVNQSDVETLLNSELSTISAQQDRQRFTTIAETETVISEESDQLREDIQYEDDFEEFDGESRPATAISTDIDEEHDNMATDYTQFSDSDGE